MIAAAAELFEARHYPGVVATCSDALEHDPDCVELRMLRARALLALRRDLEAQHDLRDLIRIDPRCGLAYRLLGELAARRDEHESAAIFFREALRLDPGDREAADWLLVVDPTGASRPASFRPAAAANQLPATAAAAGRVVAPLVAPLARTTPFARPEPMLDERPKLGFAKGTHSNGKLAEAVAAVAPALARGTRGDRGSARGEPAEPDERPTRPFCRMSDRARGSWRTPSPAAPPPIPRRPVRAASVPTERPTIPRTLAGQPATVPPAQPASRPPRVPRGAIPEAPGFGEYLVETGILTRERLRAAQAYQRSMRVQLSTAIVTLGLASPQRIEWAVVAHQSSLPRR